MNIEHTDCGSISETRTSTTRKMMGRDLGKRRQQNLQAQKKYREKLKKRLDHLETIAASITVSKDEVLEVTSKRGLAYTVQSIPSDTISKSQNCLLGDRRDECSVTFPSFNHPDCSDPSASSSDVAPWDPSVTIDPLHLIHGLNSTENMTIARVGYVDCGCCWPHIQFGLLRPREYRDVKSVNFVVKPYPAADPYVNTLRIERLCIIQAIFSNCLHIGITEEMFCDDDAISPFFKLSNKKADDASEPDCALKTIQSMRALKPDVRPVREQITTIHHPLIDVLPFPTLRKNLLKSGGDVDDELYHDLLNGLVCWGGTGVGRRDRDCSTGTVSPGTPWDSRSWEARTWFLQKYWTLLGGEEGELVRQSEWWRNVRGEEIDSGLGF